MSAPLVLRATGSHLYPGARGHIEGPMPAALAPRPCLVEFADGAAAHATLRLRQGEALLATEPYTTARGTRIPAKRWAIALGARGFRVLGRA